MALPSSHRSIVFCLHLLPVFASLVCPLIASFCHCLHLLPVLDSLVYSFTVIFCFILLLSVIDLLPGIASLVYTLIASFCFLPHRFYLLHTVVLLFASYYKLFPDFSFLLPGTPPLSAIAFCLLSLPIFATLARKLLTASCLILYASFCHCFL